MIYEVLIALPGMYRLTQFELINRWYDIGGDPVPTVVAECKITYSIITSNDKTCLKFENMEIKKLVN